MSSISNSGLKISSQKKVRNCKILVVGAGGIGCEIIKLLVKTGFRNIDIIDLDTVDVSNLNRQFLFHKNHVKMSKAKVAQEAALKYCPSASVKAYHDSIISPDYNVNFFKKFDVVLNALDNRAARNHVNRLCLAAHIPLVESGTAGYNGQVELIFKGLTKCYECDPKPAQKTYPGCTIRNTPSELIHCIVWAKHLFNQLFGAFDPDEDVSPDTADPEASGEAGKEAMNIEAKEDGNIARISTRSWAQLCSYDSEKLFKKLFHDDIRYLLSMSNLWKARCPPVPLIWSTLLGDSERNESSASEIKDHTMTLEECVKLFISSVKGLKMKFEALKKDDYLVWDKDDKDSMEFVAASANLRAYIFHIKLGTIFSIKSMAGNIIPAVTSTNTIVAGILVYRTIQILNLEINKCTTVYVRIKPNHRGTVIVPEKNLIAPDRRCYVCANKPKVKLYANVHEMLVKEFEDVVLKYSLDMVAPDVCIDDGSGTIVISSEKGETDEFREKTLSEAKIVDGTILSADDFLQDYNLSIEIEHKEKFAKNVVFELAREHDVVTTKAVAPDRRLENNKKLNGKEDGDEYDLQFVQNVKEDDDDDLKMIEPDSNSKDDINSKDVEEASSVSKKRKVEDYPDPVKKRRAKND